MSKPLYTQEQLERLIADFITKYTINDPQTIPTISMFNYQAGVTKQYWEDCKTHTPENYELYLTVRHFILTKLEHALANKPANVRGIEIYLNNAFKSEGYGNMNAFVANVEGQSKITIEVSGLSNAKPQDKDS